MVDTSEDYMLTTWDNPYNPFDEFIAWFKYDMLMKHNSCGLLDRYAKTSDLFSDERNEEIIVEAMKEIVKLEPMIYRMVTKNDFPKSFIVKRETA